MLVSKEIAEKAERFEKIKKELNALFEELGEWANEHGFEGGFICGFGRSQKPEGEEQIDGEWCDQTMRGEDSGSGTYYYPIEDSTEYMWVEYEF